MVYIDTQHYNKTRLIWVSELGFSGQRNNVRSSPPGTYCPWQTFLLTTHLPATLSPFPMTFLATATAFTHQTVLVPFCFFSSFLSRSPLCRMNSTATAASTIHPHCTAFLPVCPDDRKRLPPATLFHYVWLCFGQTVESSLLLVMIFIGIYFREEDGATMQRVAFTVRIVAQVHLSKWRIFTFLQF